MTTIAIKRVYELPSTEDGRRVLVERLWPRGMTKASLAADAWLKDVAPSAALRAWFGHRAERWQEFRRRYRAELKLRPDGWRPLLRLARRQQLTLLYSARDTERNSAVVLREFLAEQT